MPRKFNPIPPGTRFGLLTVLREGEWRGKYRTVVTRCDCGTIATQRVSHVRSGASKSCGCQVRSALLRGITRHGLSKTPEHRIWCHMLGRCLNPTDSAYSDYGGRGIMVCEAWRDFTVFYRDMGPRPSPKHSIERVDNDRGYEPDNCRWALPAEQNSNTRRNRFLTHNGVRLTIAQWSRVTQISQSAIHNRLRRGWDVDAILTTPQRKQ